MRPLAFAAAAAIAMAALACGGESSPTPSLPGDAPGAVTGPQVYFLQIET